MYQINEDLAVQVGLTQKDRKKLDKLYNKIMNILRQSYLDKKSKIKADKKVRDLEFQMQSIWKFDQNSFYHKYRFFFKGCECFNKKGIFIPSSRCEFHKRLTKR